MIYALRDGLAGARYGDRTLRRIRQHVGGDLDRGAGHLADLLDLGPTLADQGAALGRGHDQPEGDGRPGHAAAPLDVVELGTPFLELFADQGERFEDRVRRPGHRHYSFRARAVRDVDLRARLRTK